HAQGLLGIISNNSGFIGSEDGSDKVLVGLVGQVSVKVSSINGVIHNGDPLAASSIPGVAMKATNAGEIIGRALGNYTDTDTNNISTMQTSVNHTWFDPQISITDTGNINIFEKKDAPQIEGASLFGVKDSSGQEVSRVGVFSDAVIGNLKTGSI